MGKLLSSQKTKSHREVHSFWGVFATTHRSSALIAPLGPLGPQAMRVEDLAPPHAALLHGALRCGRGARRGLPGGPGSGALPGPGAPGAAARHDVGAGEALHLGPRHAPPEPRLPLRRHGPGAAVAGAPRQLRGAQGGAAVESSRHQRPAGPPWPSEPLGARPPALLRAPQLGPALPGGAKEPVPPSSREARRSRWPKGS